MERTVCHAARRMLNRLHRESVQTQLQHIQTPTRTRHFHLSRKLCQGTTDTDPPPTTQTAQMKEFVGRDTTDNGPPPTTKTAPMKQSVGRSILTRIMDDTANMRPGNRPEENGNSLQTNMDILSQPRSQSQKSNEQTSMQELLSAIELRNLPGGRGRATSRIEPIKLKPAPMRLTPALGRTVYVNANRGRDVAGALRSLGALVGRNGVARDLTRQRFHERPGLKRKRLVSERWARRFKKGFQAMVERATQIRKMGY